MAKIKNAMTYEAPKAEVIFIESQGVLCASGLHATGPGTQSMTVNGNSAIVM